MSVHVPDVQDSDPDARYIDAADFRTQGYLQEVNRQFLHPLGLALQVQIDEKGNEVFGGVLDLRDDPEGIAFESNNLAKYAEQIAQRLALRAPFRQEALGYVVQPVES